MSELANSIKAFKLASPQMRLELIACYTPPYVNACNSFLEIRPNTKQ